MTKKTITGGGKKNDAAKLRHDLIPPDALNLLAHVYTLGAKKYGDRNWEDGIAFGRVIGAIKRHTSDFEAGQNLDPEGHHHLASVAWGALALMAYQLRGMTEFDDRPGRLTTTRDIEEVLAAFKEEDNE